MAHFKSSHPLVFIHFKQTKPHSFKNHENKGDKREWQQRKPRNKKNSICFHMRIQRIHNSLLRYVHSPFVAKKNIIPI